MSLIKCQTSIGGREVSIETGKWAKQADGAVVVTSGEDSVMAAVVSSPEPSDQDFFPLKVEYQEKFYSSGRIPGGFLKGRAALLLSLFYQPA